MYRTMTYFTNTPMTRTQLENINIAYLKFVVANPEVESHEDLELVKQILEERT